MICRHCYLVATVAGKAIEKVKPLRGGGCGGVTTLANSSDDIKYVEA